MKRKILIAFAFAVIVSIVTWLVVVKIGSTHKRQIIAPDFLIKREMLPFAKEMGSGAIARYQLSTNEIKSVVSWYEQNGFSIGGGQDGIAGAGLYSHQNYMFVIHTIPRTNGSPDIVIWYCGKN